MSNSRIVVAAMAAFALIISPSFAAPLDTAAGAITQGSSSFTSANPDLFGEIEYAVFTAANFNTAFPGSGYTPDAALVYVYQVDNLGPDEVSAEIIGVTSIASNIGSADIDLLSEGFISPSTAAFVGTTAQWSFAGNPILTDQSSQGLVFSSNFLPDPGGLSITVDGGTTGQAIVPVPGSNQIPEPATAALAGLAALALFGWKTRR